MIGHEPTARSQGPGKRKCGSSWFFRSCNHNVLAYICPTAPTCDYGFSRYFERVQGYGKRLHICLGRSKGATSTAPSLRLPSLPLGRLFGNQCRLADSVFSTGAPDLREDLLRWLAHRATRQTPGGPGCKHDVTCGYIPYGDCRSWVAWLSPD